MGCREPEQVPAAGGVATERVPIGISPPPTIMVYNAGLPFAPIHTSSLSMC